MKYKDGLFAKDPRFRYFALKTLLRHRLLSKANLYVTKNNLTSMPLEDLKAKLLTDDKLKKSNHILLHHF